MFNTRLSSVRNMKRLRICVLVSVHPSGSATLFSALFSTLAHGGSGRVFWTRGGVSRVSICGAWITLLLATQAVKTLSQLRFHNVRPVTLSISPRMIRESCALNAGLLIGFSAVIIQAGVAVPLPLPPLPVLPRPGCLGNMVACMLRPLEGTLQYINVGLTIGQSFGVDNM